MNNQIFFFFYNLAHQSKKFLWGSFFFFFFFFFLFFFFLLFHHEVLKAEEPFRVFMEKKREILMVFFSGCLAWVLAYVLKFLFHTLRPFDAITQVRSLIPERSEEHTSEL